MTNKQTNTSHYRCANCVNRTSTSQTRYGAIEIVLSLIVIM